MYTMSIKIFNKRRAFYGGFGLVEIVIGAGVISASVLAISLFFQQASQVSRIAERSVSAGLLLEEGMEAMRLVRDSGWSNISDLSTTTSYYLTWNGLGWATSTTPTLIDGIFDRTVSVSPVYRDGNDDIAESGVLDAEMRKVTVLVAWASKGATTTKQVSSFLADFFD